MFNMNLKIITAHRLCIHSIERTEHNNIHNSVSYGGENFIIIEKSAQIVNDDKYKLRFVDAPIDSPPPPQAKNPV